MIVARDTPTIRYATMPVDYAALGEVCRAYVAWFSRRYDDMPWLVEEVFGHQALDEELEVLAERYGPPSGRTLLATIGDDIAGAGAWRTLSDRTCEMKRLFVTERARGLGLGRRLADALMASARFEGFATMRLDTAGRLTEAVAMYESMGFGRIAPYHEYPARLAPHLIFMETRL